MSEWHPDRNGLIFDENDATMGDCQASGAWSVRFIRDDLPCSFIEVTTAVCHNDINGDIPCDEIRYFPEVQVEYLTGSDPEDPTGTEEWSDIDYDKSYPFDFDHMEDAMKPARQIAEDYARNAAKYFDWDGQPR